jgi:hypothetical protein
LEQKYKEIENMAISKAEEEVKYFEWIAFWETSQRVRDFQLLLKDLGYFDEKDTAIFWEKTKEAVLNFQADNGIISRREDENAGIIEEKTIEAFKKSFVEKYINEELEKNPEILEEIL